MTVAAEPREDVSASDSSSAPARDTAAPSNAGASPDDIDKSLAEFDAATTRPAAPSSDDLLAAPSLEGDEQLRQEAASALRELRQQQPDNGLADLQSENAQLRGYIEREIDLADFGKLAAEVQGQLPEHLPTDYAESQLMAMAARNPELAAAFDYRNVDRRAVDAELTRVERALGQITDPKKVAVLTQYGYRLGLALNSKEIIRRAKSEVVKRGRSFHPIDVGATEDKEAIVASMRGASAKIQPEPAPDLSHMTNKQLNEWTRKNVGFDAV